MPICDLAWYPEGADGTAAPQAEPNNSLTGSQIRAHCGLNPGCTQTGSRANRGVARSVVPKIGREAW